METQGRITLSLWSWRESLEPFHKISNPIKYQIIKYLYFYTSFSHWKAVRKMAFPLLKMSPFVCVSFLQANA